MPPARTAPRRRRRRWRRPGGTERGPRGAAPRGRRRRRAGHARERPEDPPTGREVHELGRHRTPSSHVPQVPSSGYRMPHVPRSHGRAGVASVSLSGASAGRPHEQEGTTCRGVLDRLGRSAVRHHWWFISAWIVAAVLCVVARGRPRRPDQRQLHDPGRAVAGGARPARAASSRAQPGDTATVVFDAPRGIDDPQVEPAIQREHRRPREDPARHQRRPTRTGRSSAASVSKTRQDRASSRCSSTRQAQDLPRTSSTQIAAGDRSRRPQAGVELAFGGAVIDYADQPPAGQRRPHRSARRGRDPAVRVRLGGRDGAADPHRALRSRRRHLAHQHRRRRSPTSARSRPCSATMIGLGVGIDYSLFIVTRYRENLADGHGASRRRSGRSVATAGSAVLFAGCTVVIAICGLADLRHPVRRAARLHGRPRGRR